MTTTTTAEFQSNIPFIVFNASPGLAALHATRYHHLEQLRPTHCSKCGSFLLTGEGELRVQRLTKKDRVLQRTCHTCGSHDNLPLQRGNAILYSRRNRAASTPVTPSRPKPRPKKKSGLQDMLLRNKMKEEKEKRERLSGSGGLAAYLAGL